MNEPPRSLPRVVLATDQPSFSPPITCSTGTSMPSRKTSLNSRSPVICWIGRTSTPSAPIGIASMVIPRLGRAEGSVRTRAIPQLAKVAYDDHTFCPVTT